jgi:ketosteroid isomerase-like protein
METTVTTADVAAELESLRQLKARYCRFLDTKDADGWRAVFAPDVVMEADLAVSTGGADPMTAPPFVGADAVVATVLASLEGAATVHHCHTPELDLTSETTATGIWAMEDRLVFSDGRELLGAGHYHETYEKHDGTWRIKTLHLTRTLQRMTGDWSNALPAD